MNSKLECSRTDTNQVPSFGQQMEENVAQEATDRETQQKSEFWALFCS